jgi:hypothetical protein
LQNLIDDSSTFETTTRSPLTAEQREAASRLAFRAAWKASAGRSPVVEFMAPADDQPTFETTTRAPLTAGQRDERVSFSVLSQMRDVLTPLPTLPPLGMAPPRREYYGPHKPQKSHQQDDYIEPEFRTGRPKPIGGGGPSGPGDTLKYDADGWPIAPVVDYAARIAEEEIDRARAKAGMKAYLAEKAIKEAAAAAAEEAAIFAACGPGPRVSSDPRRATAETAREFSSLQSVSRAMRMGDLPAGHRDRISHAHQELMGLEAGELDDDIIDVDLTQPLADPEIEGDAEWQAENVARMKAVTNDNERTGRVMRPVADVSNGYYTTDMSKCSGSCSRFATAI